MSGGDAPTPINRAYTLRTGPDNYTGSHSMGFRLKGWLLTAIVFASIAAQATRGGLSGFSAFHDHFSLA